MNVEYINAVGSKLLDAMTHEQRQTFVQSLDDPELHTLVHMSRNHPAAVDEMVNRFVRVTTELQIIENIFGNAQAFDGCKTLPDKARAVMRAVRTLSSTSIGPPAARQAAEGFKNSAAQSDKVPQ